MSETVVKVVIIDDQQLIIDGLASVLNRSGVIEVVGSSNDPLQSHELILSHRPQVVLMDYRFPQLETDGVEIATRLIKDFPELNILMLTSYDEFALIKDALKKGLKGFLLKNTKSEDLIYAIQKVATGEYYFGPSVNKKLVEFLDETSGQNTTQPPTTSSNKKEIKHPLTKRELEISRLYSQGKTRKEIAKDLFISSNTVDTHLKNTFGKLGLRNGVELTNYLAANNLLR